MVDKLEKNEIDYCVKVVKEGLSPTEAFKLCIGTKENALKGVARLMTNPYIKSMISQLQRGGEPRNLTPQVDENTDPVTKGVTVTTQTLKLEKIYDEAMRDGKFTAALQAVMGQAKLHGIITDAEKGNSSASVNIIIEQIQQGRNRIRLGAQDQNPIKTINGEYTQ
jgi:hypothetical protein